MNVIICLSAFWILSSVNCAERNLLDTIKDDVIVTMSSVYGNNTGNMALDGVLIGDLNCARTENAMLSWMQIDLGRIYPISKIVVIGRNKESDVQNLKGFNLSLANSTHGTEQNNPLYHNDKLQNGTTDVIVLPDILTRYLKIARYGTLAICEIKIFEGDCITGHFGEECSKQCHCADIQPCNKIDGECQSHICYSGFIGKACDKECPLQYFGRECKQQCHCSNFEDCTKDHGICPGDCAPGYEGAHCEKVCQNGRYGESCAKRCGKCKDVLSCHHVTGICETGCIRGYSGQRCDDAWNLLERESVQFNISTSSTYKTWSPERAIDGNYGSDPDDCQCCSSTQNEAQSWYMIEFNEQYVLKAVEVIGREQETRFDQLQGFELILKNSSTDANIPVYVNADMERFDFVNVTLENPLARIIIIQRPGKLTICGIKVYEGACPIGRYGKECRFTCHCAENEACIKGNGTCASEQCRAGWKGTACNITCSKGYHGDACAEKCGKCQHKICHHETGECPSGCISGYEGINCKKKEESSFLIWFILLAIIGVILITCAVVAFRKYRQNHQKNYNVKENHTREDEEQEGFITL